MMSRLRTARCVAHIRAVILPFDVVQLPEGVELA